MKQLSFQDFYETSKNDCFRALSVTVRSLSEAEDLLAESYARAFSDWENIQAHPSPEAWIVRTALNLHRDRWRRLLSARKFGSSLNVEHHDKQEFVDPSLIEKIRALPEKQRQVIAFRILLDLSIEQTASEMGVAQGTVSAHLNRALIALRTSLNETNWIEGK